MQLGTVNQDIAEDEGFIRLNTDDVRHNLEDAIACVVFDGTRIILQQDGEEVAALIPCREFVRLEYLLEDLIPSPFDPCEEEYYQDDEPIHCIRPDECKTKFDAIITKVKESGELFGFLPPENLRGKNMDIFAPVAILMCLERFWVPDYLVAAKAENQL